MSKETKMTSTNHVYSSVSGWLFIKGEGNNRSFRWGGEECPLSRMVEISLDEVARHHSFVISGAVVMPSGRCYSVELSEDGRKLRLWNYERMADVGRCNDGCVFVLRSEWTKLYWNNEFGYLFRTAKFGLMSRDEFCDVDYPEEGMYPIPMYDYELGKFGYIKAWSETYKPNMWLEEKEIKGEYWVRIWESIA